MKHLAFTISGIVLAVLLYGFNITSTMHPIDSRPLVKLDKALVGNWTINEDPDKANFLQVKAHDEHTCYITYWTRGGTHPWLENFDAYLSEINGARFLNVRNFENYEEGYVIVRILDAGPGHIAFTTVHTEHLAGISGSRELKTWLGKNIDNPAVYRDTIHLVRNPFVRPRK